MAPIIQVKDLVKVFPQGRASGPEVRAVDGVSFEVGEGEFFGFLGPNGAGKTTTIKIITTLLARTAGSVTVAGHDVGREGPAIRRVIGYTGQSVGVDGDLTGRENLTLIGHLYHMPPELIRSRIDELMKLLQLSEALDRPAGTYSGGMRRRLDLAAGLIQHPRILFLDEPTTGLDPQTRNAVWEHLRCLHKDEGMTIFLTTQYMEEADRLCERLAIIDRGKIVASGSPAALKAGLGGDVVTIRLLQDERFADRQRQALDIVGNVPGVVRAAPFEEGVSVHVSDGGSVLQEILRRFDAEHAPVRQLAISQPSLDEVFLEHTGREMRVEEVRQSRGWAGRRR